MFARHTLEIPPRVRPFCSGMDVYHLAASKGCLRGSSDGSEVAQIGSSLGPLVRPSSCPILKLAGHAYRTASATTVQRRAHSHQRVSHASQCLHSDATAASLSGTKCADTGQAHPRQRVSHGSLLGWFDRSVSPPRLSDKRTCVRVSSAPPVMETWHARSRSRAGMCSRAEQNWR